MNYKAFDSADNSLHWWLLSLTFQCQSNVSLCTFVYTWVWVIPFYVTYLNTTCGSEVVSEFHTHKATIHQTISCDAAIHSILKKPTHEHILPLPNETWSDEFSLTQLGKQQSFCLHLSFSLYRWPHRLAFHNIVRIQWPTSIGQVCFKIHLVNGNQLNCLSSILSLPFISKTPEITFLNTILDTTLFSWNFHFRFLNGATNLYS